MEYFHRRQKWTVIQFCIFSMCQNDNAHHQTPKKYHWFSAFGFSVGWIRAAVEALCGPCCCAYLGFAYEKKGN